MGRWQWRQRPRNSSQPSTGKLSYQRRRVPQWGQWLGGATIDSSRGTRQATRLRKLPKQAPTRAAIRGKNCIQLRRGERGGR